MIALVFAAAVMLTAELPREPVEVLEIRGRYNEVMEGIEEGSFYRTEVEINPDDLPYPAVGHYQAWIILYWNAAVLKGGRALVLERWRLPGRTRSTGKAAGSIQNPLASVRSPVIQGWSSLSHPRIQD